MEWNVFIIVSKSSNGAMHQNKLNEINGTSVLIIPLTGSGRVISPRSTGRLPPNSLTSAQFISKIYRRNKILAWISDRGFELFLLLFRPIFFVQVSLRFYTSPLSLATGTEHHCRKCVLCHEVINGTRTHFLSRWNNKIAGCVPFTLEQTMFPALVTG